MKKISLAKEFIPTNRQDPHKFIISSFKDWVARQKELKFASQTALLSDKWGKLHHMTWLAAIKREGQFRGKRNKGVLIVDLIKDFLEIFNHSCYQELQILDSFIAKLPRTQIINCAKFKESNFGDFARPTVLNLFKAAGIFDNPAFQEERDTSLLIPIFEQFCSTIISNFENMPVTAELEDVLALAPDPVTNLPVRLGLENMTAYCLWDDFWALKEAYQCPMTFKAHKDVDYCRNLFREDCNVENCTKYHLTNLDLGFLECWTTKVKRFVKQRLESSHILRLVFVDIDNCKSPEMYDLFEMGEMTSRDEIFLIYGRYAAFAKYSQERLAEYMVIIPNFLKVADSADIDILKDAIYWDESVPANIDFVFISADAFLLELIPYMRTKRNCILLPHPSKDLMFVHAWNKEFKRLAELRHLTSTIQQWTLSKPSRVASLILSRDESFCCFLEKNGLPCMRPRFLSLLTCEKHC